MNQDSARLKTLIQSEYRNEADLVTRRDLSHLRMTPGQHCPQTHFRFRDPTWTLMNIVRNGPHRSKKMKHLKQLRSLPDLNVKSRDSSADNAASSYMLSVPRLLKFRPDITALVDWA